MLALTSSIQARNFSAPTIGDLPGRAHTSGPCERRGSGTNPTTYANSRHAATNVRPQTTSRLTVGPLVARVEGGRSNCNPPPRGALRQFVSTVCRRAVNCMEAL